MDRFDDDALFAELRAVRPTPRPEFTAELDEHAAAGFPRRSAPSVAATPFARLADHWRALSPRRRFVPVMATVLAALVVATGVVAIVGSGGGSSSELGHNGHVLSDVERFGSSQSAEAGAAIEAAPEAEGPQHAGEKAPKAAGAESAEAEESSAESVRPFAAPVAPLTKSAGRDIERSAYVVLGTKPGEVAGASAKVYEAVHAADGVVLHSSVKSGSKGATGASFELLIPSRKLDDTLAAFSQIAEVRERHDATNDITKQTIGAGEELADSNATIESLLKELGDAESESERETLETRLREERRRHAGIATSLDHLRKRASMSEVSVRIVTDHGAGVTPAAKGSDGGWSVGDALHDAGKILTIAAGIVLIALAVLAPLALIALLTWLANRFRVRRLRERTLS
jgi:Domain of unknown function (DUF4349)